MRRVLTIIPLMAVTALSQTAQTPSPAQDTSGAHPPSSNADFQRNKASGPVAPSGREIRSPQWHGRTPRYQVRPGDVLDISFSPTAEFNQTLSIQPDGYVTLREIGDLHILGKTVPEVTQAITSAYAKILRDPVVTVVLKEFEKPHFTVGGQVQRPGKYDLRADTTLSEAVTIAGSFTEKAKHSQILLFRRISDDWVEVKEIDLKKLYQGDLREDIHLRPGDMVFVPQNRISKIKPFLPVGAVGAYLSPRL